MSIDPAAVTWTRAKTYPDAPHEYIVRHDQPALWEHFRECIKKHGQPLVFTLRGRTLTYRVYLPGDGYRYWLMGVVLNRTQANAPTSDGTEARHAP
jgi:hypothetical protein